MKKLFKITKSKVLGVAFGLLVLMPIFALAANSPALDPVGLYQIGNRNNSPDWGTSTTAVPGQKVAFLIHVHNNNLETTAYNIRARATLSSGVVTSYTSTATLSATNASPVSGNVSYSFSTPAYLEYVPGSTVLYNAQNQQERVLPDGITTGGIDTGVNLQGCWDYQKWIIFQAIVKAPENPTLYFCNSETSCASTKQYKDTNECQIGSGKPCYTTEGSCRATTATYCPLPNPTLYYCSTDSSCANTKQYKTTSACQIGVGKPCYTSETA